MRYIFWSLTLSEAWHFLKLTIFWSLTSYSYIQFKHMWIPKWILDWKNKWNWYQLSNATVRKVEESGLFTFSFFIQVQVPVVSGVSIMKLTNFAFCWFNNDESFDTSVMTIQVTFGVQLTKAVLALKNNKSLEVYEQTFETPQFLHYHITLITIKHLFTFKYN